MRSKRRGSRLLTAVLMPIALLPIGLAVPEIVESRRAWERRHESAPHSPPAIRLTAAQQRRFRPVAAYRRAVPVLLYHGLNTTRDGQSVSRRDFAEQMAALHQMRFHAIGIADYVRFRRGDSSGLPSRPILITFDDGRLDSYRGADRVLARYGFKATIFVPTAELERESSAHLTWRELGEMDESGRWDVQSQGHEADRLVATNSRGATKPFYAARRYTMSEGLETLAEFEQRVAEDLFSARDALEEHGFRPVSFAVPFGDYGQRAGGNAHIARLMRQLMTRQFQTVLVQDAANAPAYTRAGGEAERYEVRSSTTTDQLYMWLRDQSPAWIETHGDRSAVPRQQDARRWLHQSAARFRGDAALQAKGRQ